MTIGDTSPIPPLPQESGARSAPPPSQGGAGGGSAAEDAPPSHALPLLLVALLTLAAAAVRVWPLASRSLWHDEAMTWKAVQTGPWAILTWTHHYEHPPLSYALVWLSIQIFGHDGEWVVRLPSFLAGVLCVPAAYWLGRTLASPWLGVLAAAQVAFDLNAVAQSQQARMYTLTVLCALVTLALAFRAVTHFAPWRWIAVGVGLAAAFAASHMGAMLWAALPLGLATWKLLPGKLRGGSRKLRGGSPEPPPTTHRRLLPGLALAYLTALLLDSVGLYVMAGRLSWFRAKSGSTPLADRFAGLFNDWAHAYGSAPLAVLLLLAGLVGLALLYRHHRPAALVLLALVLVNALFALPVQPHGFEPRPRYVILTQLSVWFGVAALLLAIRPRPARILALLALAAVLAWNVERSLGLGHNWQYRFGDAIRLVQTRVGPGDAVLYYPAWVEGVPVYEGLPPTHNPPPWGGTSDYARLPFDALPTDRPTWAIVAYHHETGATDAAPDLLAAVAAHHGLTVDPARFRPQFRDHPIVIARIDARGVVFVDLSEALDIDPTRAATPPG